MASSKPRASHYRHQFGEVYEFAINYIQALKNRLIRNLPSTRASEESISLQIKEKANHYKDKLDVANTDIKRLEAETEKLRREVEKMQAELRRNQETIGDLMRKRWMQPAPAPRRGHSPLGSEDAPPKIKLKGLSRTTTKLLDEFMTWASGYKFKPMVVLRSTKVALRDRRTQ